MNEEEAKRQLRRIAKSFTAGSILHLLADLQRDAAAQAHQNNEEQHRDQHTLVEHALVVMGMGIDAALPS